MKTLYSIINFPIALILGIITSIICLPLIIEKVRKYNRQEIDQTTMLAEVSTIINNFPLMFLWLSVNAGLRALVTIAISFYIFY